MLFRHSKIFISTLSIVMFLGNYATPITIDAATKTYSFSANSNKTQTQTFALPTDFVSMNSVKVNTGDVSYSIEEGNIKITVSNGDAVSKESFHNDKLHLLPDYTATIYSDTNNFDNTIIYETSDGFSGSLSLKASPYVSSGEVTTGTQMNVSVTQKSSVNDFPNTILYDENSFKGTLSKNGSPTRLLVSGGSYTQDSKTATTTLDNSANSFGSTTVYDDGNYRGTLSKNGTSTQYVASGSYTPAQSKTVSQNKTSSSNSFASTISYSDGSGYSGTLSKNGSVTSTVVSGSYTAAQSKTVSQSKTSSTNSFANTISYNSDGYSGTLSKSGSVTSTVVSGSYTAAQSKTVSQSKTSTTNSFASTISYNSGGYSGTLSKDGSVTSKVTSGEAPKSLAVEFTISGICDDYFYWDANKKKWWDDPDDMGYSDAIGSLWVKPASGQLPIASGTFKGLNVVSGFDHSTATRPTGGTTLKMQITKNGYTYSGTINSVSGTMADCETSTTPTSLGIKGTTHKQQYTIKNGTTPSRKFSGTLYTPDTRKYEYTQKYSGTVTKPAVDTRVYSYTQNYSGTVTKPAVDTRVYSYTQNYSGTVTKPAVDTRVYAYKQNYSGEATRYLKVTETLQSDTDSFPSSITYENQNGYKGTLSKSGNAILDDDLYEQNYTGYIYSQTIDNSEYEYSQLYSGTVSQEGEDSRVWAADYTGTLYKGGIDYTNEQYAYTVTLDYDTTKHSNCSYLGVSTPSTTVLNYKPKCTTLNNGTDNLYSFFYDFKVTGISNVQAGK